MAMKPSHIKGSDFAFLRTASGPTQAELGETIGCGRHAVGYWEAKGIVPLAHGVPARIAAQFSDFLRYFRDPAKRAHLGSVVPRNTVQHGKQRPTCGAKTRNDHPCRAKGEPGRKRCELHGGLSTGPRTQEGRNRISLAQQQRCAEWREAKAMHSIGDAS